MKMLIYGDCYASVGGRGIYGSTVCLPLNFAMNLKLLLKKKSKKKQKAPNYSPKAERGKTGSVMSGSQVGRAKFWNVDSECLDPH